MTASVLSTMSKQPKTPNIRAVIFDYGEVLCTAPPADSLDFMASVFNVSREKFHQLYHENRERYDRGDLSPEEYWALIASRTGVALKPGPLRQLRDADVEMWSNLNQTMLRWAFEIRSRGVKTAILSNMHADMATLVRQRFDWLSKFDCLVLSSELGLTKPAAAIFEHCLDCLDVPADEALFLDDREANVRGAQKAGIHGIVVRSLVQFRQELQAIGFSPLPNGAE
jgi:putative hydrolase of the HAD superfamily